MEVDLNNPALPDEENPQEVLLHPAQPNEPFIELNDILQGNNVVEEAINNVLPPPIPEEQVLLNLADDPQNVPFLPANHINMVVEEIPLDQLMDVEEMENLNGQGDLQDQADEKGNLNDQEEQQDQEVENFFQDLINHDDEDEQDGPGQHAAQGA